MSVEYRPSVGRVVDRSICQVSADSVGRVNLPTYSTDISADTRPILDRHLGRRSGKVSTDTWSNVGRYVLQVGRPPVPTIGRYLIGMAIGLHSADSSTVMLR